VCGEVLEEINEILEVLDRLGRDRVITIMAPRAVLEQLPPARLRRQRTVRAVAAGYGQWARKLVGALQFGVVVLSTRAHEVWSGFPMLKHRLFRFLGYRHVAYYRALMLDPSVRAGFSDKVRHAVSGHTFLERVMGEPDIVATSSRLNVPWLESRHIPTSRIVVIGAIWLERLPPPRHVDRGRVIFLTSALSQHGHPGEHDLQVETLARAVQVLASRGESHAQEPDLVLRVHPRDLYDYGRDERFDVCTIDRSSPAEFLASVGPMDVVISPLSTLAFEARARNARVVVVDAPYFPGASASELLGQEPISLDDVINGRLEAVASIPRAFGVVTLDHLRQLLDAREVVQ
jgi:hypothetical protein